MKSVHTWKRDPLGFRLVCKVCGRQWRPDALREPRGECTPLERFDKAVAS